MVDELSLPAIPSELLDGASVATVDERVAHRPWGNEGQAFVSVITLTLSDGGTRRLVWKRTRVPKAEPSSGGTAHQDKRLAAIEADKRLKSFEAEAAFFGHCAPRLTAAGATVPRAWSVAHSQQRREFSLLMSDLVSDGFPRQPEALGFSEATSALRWLATLHAEFWDDPGLPSAGLWRHGSYWDLGKRGHELDERRMSKHWRDSASHLRRAAGRARDTLVPRLVRAALPLDAALRPPDGESPANGGQGEQRSRRAPKRRAAGAVEADEPTLAAIGVRLRMHHTIVHGDFKGENLFFTPMATDASAACSCAACDFQWAGPGVGALDVLYLLTTSLDAGLLREREGTLLREYHSALCERLEQKEQKEAPSWRQFELEYAVALLDFMRFVLADGVLVDGDEWLVERTAALLERLDGGKILPGSQYAEALNACADTAGPCALVGLVVGADELFQSSYPV